jgi:hypothetical protein
LAPAATLAIFTAAIGTPFRTLRESTGFPALKAHDNIVATPIGPALAVTALGPVSVLGNQLTTGYVRHVPDSSSFIPVLFAPATVFIFNLGLSNENYAQLLFGLFGPPGGASISQLDDMRLGERLANGNVLFANNQCSLDLLELGETGTIPQSILVATADDLGFLNNQCDCNLGFDDFVVNHAVLGASSIRVIGNRFKESALSALYSAYTYGHLNITAHNESTHCLMVTTDATGQKKDGPNLILYSDHCRVGYTDTARALAEIKAKQ